MREKTFRAVLKLRARIAIGLAIGGWITIMAAGIYSGTHKRTPPSPLAFIGFVVFFLAIIVVNWWLRCPKCRRKVGQNIGLQVGIGGKKAPNFCPYCGVHLDDPLPAPPNPADEVTTPDKLIWK